MSRAIHELTAGGPPSEEGLLAFLEENDFPLVEGTSVTFVYRGEADAVLLQHFIFGLPTSQPFHRVAGTDLWYRTVEIPEGSRVEYKFDVVIGDAHRWIRDPLNEHLARDPFGANSVVHGSGYERPSWTFRDPEARPGSIEEMRVHSKALRARRRVDVYLPARYRPTRRYPLLVLHDGDDFQRFAGVETVLDNLIHRLEIPPMIVALTSSPRRLVEYGASEAHSRFIVDELLPRLEKRYPVDARPEARGLAGASFGAVASLSTAWRNQSLFGRLLLLSGSFAFTDIGRHERGPAFDPVVEFMNEFRERPGNPAEKIYVACGIYESLIYENRSLVPLLQANGLEVRYEEVRDGHNWENWRDRLRLSLSWLFPGPLWMVYE